MSPVVPSYLRTSTVADTYSRCRNKVQSLTPTVADTYIPDKVQHRNTVPLRNHWRPSIEDGGSSMRGISKEYLVGKSI
jgi:hypothetical protein